jgi:pyruvate/2-oxoacid:ferredoxin oxidoreductase alpha subunit/ferredoxin
MADVLRGARELVRRGVGALAGVEGPEVHPGTAAALTGAEAVARVEEACGATFAEGVTGRGRLATAMGLAAAGERAAVRLTGPELSEAAELLGAAAERRLPLVVHWASGPDGFAPLHRAAGSGAVVLVAADAQEAADLALVARRVAEEALLPAVVAQDGAETWRSVQDLFVPDAASVRRLLGAPGDTVHPASRSQELLFGRHRRRTVRWHDPARPMAAGAPSGPEVRGLAAAGRRAYLDAEVAEILERAFAAFARETGRRHDALAAHRLERAGLALVALGAAAATAGAVADGIRRDGPAVGVVGLRCLRPLPAERLAKLLCRAPAVVVLERLDAPLGEEGPLAAEVRAALSRYEERAGGAPRRGASWSGTGAYGRPPSLTAEVRAVLTEQGEAADSEDRGEAVAAEARRHGRRVAPPVTSVLVPGVLRGADVASLLRNLGGSVSAGLPGHAGGAGREVEEGVASPLYLGVAFDGAPERYPKREVLRDALRSAYPGAETLGLRAPYQVKGPAPDARPPGTVSVAVHRVGERGSDLAGEAAALLHAVTEGPVRSASDPSPAVRGEARADRLHWAPLGAPRLPEPGPDAPVDVAVWAGPGTPPPGLVAHLAPGAAVLIPTPRPGRHGDRPLQPPVHSRPTGTDAHPAEPACKSGPGPAKANPPEAAGLRAGRGGGADSAPDTTDWWTSLPQVVRDAVSVHGAKLFTLDTAADDPPELLLGALLGLLAKTGKLDVKPRKLLDARRERLAARAVPPQDLDRRLAALQAGLDRVRPLPAAELQVRRSPAPEADDVPAAVRRAVADASPAARDTVDALPRFWDQVGVPWRRGGASDLTPDPYLATGTLPALSGALRDTSAGRELLPAFDPAACTGCGACWASCPHGAVAPLVLGAAALLDHGMALAKRRGAPADALRMAAGKLAAAVNQELAAWPTGGAAAGELLDAAFARTMAKLPLPEERKAAVREAFAAVREELADLPLARTAPFFEAPEADEPGSGELLALGVDPSACTGCGVCVAACEPGALSSVPDDPVRTRDARRLLRLVEELPEPSERAVERARSHPEAGQSSGVLAGALLPRSSRRVMTAGDGAEPGSGEALAVRQALGAAAFHRAPVRRERLAALEALSEELAGAIHEGLSRSLPDRDLNALSLGLAALDRPEAELAELTGRIEAALSPDQAAHRVDVARLRRLVEAAREVADLRLRLSASAPFGLVLAGGPAAWGATFPHDAFAVPVTVAPPGAAAAMARGLAEGAAREAVAAARTARTARLALGAVTGPEAARAAEEVKALAGLSWSDLEEEERGCATPVLLVASEDELAEDPGGLVELLATDLPAKVLSLTPSAAGAAALPLTDLLGSRALALASVADGDALEAAVAAAMAQRAPALLRVLAPSPGRDGFPPAELLERTRAAWTEAPAGEDQPAVDEVAAERERAEAAERRHADELAALRASYEARLAEQQTTSRLALAQEVRARLLRLATRPKPEPAAEDAEVRP